MTFHIVSSSIAFVCYGALVVLTLRQSRRNRVNNWFTLYLLSMLFWQCTALLVSISNEPATALLGYRLMIAGVAGQFLIYLVFTRAFLQIKGQRWSVVVGVLALLLVLVMVVSGTPAFISGVYRDEQTRLFVPTYGALLPVVGALSYFSLGYGVFNLVREYRRPGTERQRNRLRYLLLGVSVVIAGTVANFIPPLRGQPVEVLSNIISALIIAYAILRHQLLDIRIVVRKGLLYSIPTVIIGAGYFAIISIVVRLFDAFAGPQILSISLIVAVVTAVAAQPLRDRAQRWIDRLFFREKYDANQMLQRLSGTAAAVLDLSTLTNLILREVTATMHIERAAFLLKDEKSGEFRLTAQRGMASSAGFKLGAGHPVVGWLSNNQGLLTGQDIDVLPQFRALWGREREEIEDTGAELLIPLKAKGELVGIFMVGAKRSEEAHSQDDQSVLTTLANQTAMAIDNARLFEEAQRRASALAGALVRLQELDRLKSEFIQSASHELRTPIALIRGYAELMEADELGDLHTQQRGPVSVIARRARQLSTLVEDILLILEAEAQPPSPQPVYLHQLARMAVDDFQVAASQAGVTLTAGIPPDLPPVSGTESYLRRVLDNLLGNAIKFTPAEGRITVRVKEEGKHVVLQVSDTGIGIPQDQLERVFERFHQVDGSTKRRYGGVGLGLAVVKQAVEAYGGRVSVASTLGHGSTFTVTMRVFGLED